MSVFALSGLIVLSLALTALYFRQMQTSRRQAKRLKEAQLRSRLWQDASVELMVLLAVEGEMCFRILTVNRAFERFNHHYGKSDYVADPIGSLLDDYLLHKLELSPGEVEYKLQLYQRCVAQRQKIRFEEQTRIPRLGEVISHTTLSPVLDEKGAVCQICYTAFNTTALRNADHASYEARRLLEEAQKMAGIGVWQWNAEISEFEWSESMQEIFGMEARQTPSFEQWVGMVHPEDEERVRREIELAFEQKEPFMVEHKIIRPDGQIRHLKTWGGLRISEKGEIREVFGISLDRTAEKEAEDHLLSAVLKAEDKARQSIARDLHDGLGQRLTTVLLNLNTLRKEEEALSEKARERLHIARSFLDQAMIESRNIAHALMPQVVVEFGYILAMENLLTGLRSAQMQFHFLHNLPGNGKLPTKTAVSLYRISQEAIQNILKHSGATEVVIQLSLDEQLLQLTIEDDGKGFSFPEDKTPLSGLGLNNIRTRVKAMGGLFFVDTRPGAGTLLTIQLPISQSEYAPLQHPAG